LRVGGRGWAWDGRDGYLVSHLSHAMPHSHCAGDEKHNAHQMETWLASLFLIVHVLCGYVCHRRPNLTCRQTGVCEISGRQLLLQASHLASWCQQPSPPHQHPTACTIVPHRYIISAAVINQALAHKILPPDPTRLQWFLMTLGTEASYFLVANITPALR
jgi:hypothetical protein